MKLILFSSFVPLGQRTIVVFIRHWYCPLCSDYVYSIVEQVQPEALERAGAKRMSQLSFLDPPFRADPPLSNLQ